VPGWLRRRLVPASTVVSGVPSMASVYSILRGIGGTDLSVRVAVRPESPGGEGTDQNTLSAVAAPTTLKMAPTVTAFTVVSAIAVRDGSARIPPSLRNVVGADSASASTAVVEAIASIRHCEPTDLEPLYNSVDSDALDAIIDGSDDGSVTVSLVANGLEVAVGSDGTVEIEPPDIEEI
jgi:hypothetical protein